MRSRAFDGHVTNSHVVYRSHDLACGTKMNEGPVLLSPTFPPPPGALAGGGFGGFESRVRKGVMRKTVDYQASTLRYLEVSKSRVHSTTLMVKRAKSLSVSLNSFLALLFVCQNRIWQRGKRDCPVLQPDSAYFNDVSTCHQTGVKFV